MSGPRPRARAIATGLALVMCALPAAEPGGVDDAAVAADIEAILSAPPFRVAETTRELVPVDGPDEEPSEPVRRRSARATGDGDWISLLARIAEGVLWALVAFAVVWLALDHRRWRGLLPSPRRALPASRTSVPAFGALDADAPLPGDVPGQARCLWRAGEARAALALLFRGALEALVRRHGVSFGDAATEGECVRLVEASAPAAPAAYFRDLCRAWQRVAYAKRVLRDDEAARLIDGWTTHFGAAT